MTLIYGLVDPRSQYLRYVGKTVSSLKVRLGQHVSDARRESTHKANWLRDLAGIGLKPDIFLIEEVEGDGAESEIHHIAQLRAIGCPLTNLSVGGEGRFNVKLTEEHRKKIGDALRGKPQSAELVRKRTHMRQGSRHTPESIEKMRKSQTGISPSPETREKLRRANLRIQDRPWMKKVVASSRARRLFRLLVKSAVQNARSVDDRDGL